MEKECIECKTGEAAMFERGLEYCDECRKCTKAERLNEYYAEKGEKWIDFEAYPLD